MGKINKFFKNKDKKNSKDNIVPNQPVPGQNRSFNDITDQFKTPEMEQQFNKKIKLKRITIIGIYIQMKKGGKYLLIQFME